MLIFLFFALFIAILAIIFAVQNNQPATVSFLLWDTDGSLALVILIAIAAGALISFLASLPSNVKSQLAIRNMRKQIQELELNLQEQNQQLEEKRIVKPDTDIIQDTTDGNESET